MASFESSENQSTGFKQGITFDDTWRYLSWGLAWNPGRFSVIFWYPPTTGLYTLQQAFLNTLEQSEEEEVFTSFEVWSCNKGQSHYTMSCPFFKAIVSNSAAPTIAC